MARHRFNKSLRVFGYNTELLGIDGAKQRQFGSGNIPGEWIA